MRPSQRPTATGMRVRSTRDANVLFHAVTCGILPMVQRRLDAADRAALRPGCVYIWEERSPASDATGAGMERFTEGRHWHPSRVRDDFLLYVEKDWEMNESQAAERNRMLRHHHESYSSTSYPVQPMRRQPLVKQTYSAWVNTGTSLKKWHMNAYYTEDSLEELRTVDDIVELANLPVPHECYQRARSSTVGTSKKPERSSSTRESFPADVQLPHPPRRNSISTASQSSQSDREQQQPQQLYPHPHPHLHPHPPHPHLMYHPFSAPSRYSPFPPSPVFTTAPSSSPTRDHSAPAPAPFPGTGTGYPGRVVRAQNSRPPPFPPLLMPSQVPGPGPTARAATTTIADTYPYPYPYRSSPNFPPPSPSPSVASSHPSSSSLPSPPGPVDDRPGPGPGSSPLLLCLPAAAGRPTPATPTPSIPGTGTSPLGSEKSMSPSGMGMETIRSLVPLEHLRAGHHAHAHAKVRREPADDEILRSFRPL